MAQIATEKAGIIKPKTPIIISETQKEIKHIEFDEVMRQEEKSGILFNATPTKIFVLYVIVHNILKLNQPHGFLDIFVQT